MIENFDFESQGIDPCGPRSPLMTLNDLITATETAQRLHVSYSTMKRWRRTGTGPEWCRLGGRAIRYRVVSLEAWVSSQARGPHRSPVGSNVTPDGPAALTGIIPLPELESTVFAGKASSPII
jgi:predicted DNA-binding transcriptional regulator AlpA